MSDAQQESLVPGREILGRHIFADRDCRVLRYDFKRPDKVSKEQIVSIRIMHDTFARLAKLRLSSLLRVGCEVSLSLVDQMTYGEFMQGLPSKASLATIALKPLVGNGLLHLDAALSGFILERLFGAGLGDAEAAGAAPYPEDLTDIECTALEEAVRSLLPDLTRGWEEVEILDPSLVAIETDPAFCQIVPPTEMIILVGLEVDIGQLKGHIDLVYPFIAIEAIINRLSAQYWYDSAKGQSLASVPSSSFAYRMEAPASLLFEGRPLSIGELRSLRRGSLVAIPGLDEGLGRLRAGDRLVARLRLLESKPAGPYRLEMLPSDAEAGPGEVSEPGSDAAGATTALRLSLAGLEASLASIGAGLKAGFSGLGERIGTLEGRQEALADRLLFGQSDLHRDEARGDGRPFSSLASLPAEALALFLGSERPQVAALVLAWLDDQQASAVLDNLPESGQAETIRRLSTMEASQPLVLSAVERVLATKLSTIGKERQTPGGLSKIVGLLNLSRRATERRVIESLQAWSPALAEEIKKNMFVFEDISLLDAESIVCLLERVSEEDLVLALKPLDPSIRAKVLGRFAKAAGARLLAKVEAMGRVRLSECDAAGQRIVAVVRSLEEEGLIELSREASSS
ncbi:MAG TPA: FliG C-terminal domain-containing protein [Rectinemataceae bacterium]|nr:FliG C-terminal domain-containing protein [Rectinemataceae bacterium]